jgi:hypothetical protein
VGVGIRWFEGSRGTAYGRALALEGKPRLSICRSGLFWVGLTFSVGRTPMWCVSEEETSLPMAGDCNTLLVRDGQQ